MLDETNRAVVINNGNLFFGGFLQCQIKLKKGDFWDIVHDGGNITILKHGDTTIEIRREDFIAHFDLDIQ